MNKQTIIQEIQESKMTQDVKDYLLEELNQYPDELSEEDAKKIVKLLKDTQLEEYSRARDLDDLGNATQELVDELDENEAKFVADQIEEMKNTLKETEAVLT